MSDTALVQCSVLDIHPVDKGQLLAASSMAIVINRLPSQMDFLLATQDGLLDLQRYRSRDGARGGHSDSRGSSEPPGRMPFAIFAATSASVGG